MFKRKCEQKAYLFLEYETVEISRAYSEEGGLSEFATLIIYWNQGVGREKQLVTYLVEIGLAEQGLGGITKSKTIFIVTEDRILQRARFERTQLIEEEICDSIYFKIHIHVGGNSWKGRKKSLMQKCFIKFERINYTVSFYFIFFLNHFRVFVMFVLSVLLVRNSLLSLWTRTAPAFSLEVTETSVLSISISHFFSSI